MFVKLLIDHCEIVDPPIPYMTHYIAMGIP